MKSRQGGQGVLNTVVLLSLVAPPVSSFAALSQEPNTWVKRSPLPGGPPSPRLGYEGACVWDTKHHLLIRYGGHNQGGGGAQYSEVWTFDLKTARWTLKLPNTSPPGVCCAQQNVFDPISARYIRFPAFSGNHGWQWFREIYLNNATIWMYDLESNRWINRNPVPTPRVSPLRCASWDSDAQVVVLFGGEGNREGTVIYNPYTNSWTRARPPFEPPFRSAGNMTYDSKRKRHILFGAQFSDDPHTWAYDIRKNRWIDLKPDRLPPTNRNDAVLVYDDRSDVVICIVHDEGTDKLETWAYAPGSNSWRPLKPPSEPDRSGNRARVLSYAPEYGLVVLENRTKSKPGPPEQQIWTYLYAGAPPPPGPAAPGGLAVRTSGDSAVLTWRPSPDREVTGYLLLRGTGPEPWRVTFRQLRRLPPHATEFVDRGLERGKVYYYALVSLSGDKKGPRSIVVRTQPPVVEDVVVSVLSEKEVEVSWRPPPEAKDVVRYRIERAPCLVWSEAQLTRLRRGKPERPEPAVGSVRAIGPFVTVAEVPASTLAIKDRVDLRSPIRKIEKPIYKAPFYKTNLKPDGIPYRYAVYAYRIRAINALGVSGGPSPYVLTIPSMPQWVFSLEKGKTCMLKWAPNLEKNLRGYLVYRLDGRWHKDPISLLTPDPIKQTTFTDRTAGESTRRYYIVAVDGLGQEGAPSRPVWYRREWERFYRPFVSGWHQ